jgi:hypothetical protein
MKKFKLGKCVLLGTAGGWLVGGLLVAFTLTLGTLEPAEAKSPKAKKYYLTIDTFQGNEALTACDAKFHMASFWEIRDPTNLKYDTARGFTRTDSGFGPPTISSGWIRTGNQASASAVAGRGNCGAWTSNSSGDNGTAIRLIDIWSDSGMAISPWEPSTATACDIMRPVWCVED